MSYGWQCPVCNRGNAPWVATCECHVVVAPVSYTVNGYTRCDRCGTLYLPHTTHSCATVRPLTGM